MLGYAGETHCRNLQGECDTTLDSVFNLWNLNTQFKYSQYMFTHTFTSAEFLSDAVIDCLSTPTEDEWCMTTGARAETLSPICMAS